VIEQIRVRVRTLTRACRTKETATSSASTSHTREPPLSSVLFEYDKAHLQLLGPELQVIYDAKIVSEARRTLTILLPKDYNSIPNAITVIFRSTRWLTYISQI
jgi:hypothetical protein